MTKEYLARDRAVPHGNLHGLPAALALLVLPRRLWGGLSEAPEAHLERRDGYANVHGSSHPLRPGQGNLYPTIRRVGDNWKNREGIPA